MRPGKKPVSCTPCAKRKVRCDKLQPCQHCRRRPRDECVYPSSEPSHELIKQYAERIEQLERRIRELGRESNDERRGQDSSSATPSSNSPRSSAARARRPSSLMYEGTNSSILPPGTISGLVGEDEQQTYIEAPVWNSWNGANQPSQNPTNFIGSKDPITSTTSRSPSCFAFILDPQNIDQKTSLCFQQPQPAAITFLWKTFLTNVHPLVKIFFDWEIEPIIQRACHGILLISKGERALLFAICFIATHSLPRNECLSALSGEKFELLGRWQRATEDALLYAEFVTTSDRLTLHSLMLYLTVMRDRAHPTAIFSLMGLARRIAQRMGIHRDGAALGLGVVRSEERRRVWYQLQYMEIAVSRVLGSLCLSLYADWDAKIPSNLEDSDFCSDMQALPAERKGLTSMSHCLWRYSILAMQREKHHSGETFKGLPEWLSPHIPLSRKDSYIDDLEGIFGTRFLQYCEPLNPLHIYIQIGIRHFMLEARRTVRQPGVVNAKISEMSWELRNDFLGICTKALEYHLLTQTNEAVAGFCWFNENYFQAVPFVYVVLEAHHRAARPEVASLWTLIEKVYDVHPDLESAALRPEMATVARMTYAAWQEYEKKPQATPSWIVDVCRVFDIPMATTTAAAAAAANVDATAVPREVDAVATRERVRAPAADGVRREEDVGAHEDEPLLPLDFDFNMIDWSVWEQPYLNSAVYTA